MKKNKTAGSKKLSLLFDRIRSVRLPKSVMAVFFAASSAFMIRPSAADARQTNVFIGPQDDTVRFTPLDAKYHPDKNKADPANKFTKTNILKFEFLPNNRIRGYVAVIKPRKKVAVAAVFPDKKYGSDAKCPQVHADEIEAKAGLVFFWTDPRGKTHYVAGKIEADLGPGGDSLKQAFKENGCLVVQLEGNKSDLPLAVKVPVRPGV